MDWFTYDRNFRYERVNALLLAYIHRDVLLDYDKTIDIFESKYVETFNARKTYKAYIDFAFLVYILSL